MHKTSRDRPSPTATNAGTRQTNSMHKTSRNRPSPSDTNAGTRRINSMHKTSRNRPVPLPPQPPERGGPTPMHKTSRISPRPLPPHTPERGGPAPCTKRAGIAPSPSDTHAGTRQTNSMHKTSRYRPDRPFRHTRRNAADQLHAQNEPESRTLNELAPRVGFEPTTNRLTADRSTD